MSLGPIQTSVAEAAGGDLSFADYRATTFRPGFDGLRAIGFLLVVTAHIPAVPLFAYLQGWTAVWVFFAISGYLLTMLLIREERKTGGVAFGPFMVRRVARIVPSYAAAILIYWIAVATLPPLADEYALFMQRLPYYLTLMPEYSNTTGFNIFTHAWTVGVEMKFYLFFPAIVFLLIRTIHKDAWRFAVTAVTTAVLMMQGSFTANAYGAILAGAMLAQLLEWPPAYAAIATLTRVPLVVPMGFVVALFALLLYVEVLPAVTLVATYLVAYLILHDSMLRRGLASAPLIYLGQRSYGAYLLHVLAIRFGYMMFGSTTPLAGWLTAVTTLVLTIPAAELLYRAVEAPGVELGRRISNRLRRAAKPA